jgi:hypothetical protein
MNTVPAVWELKKQPTANVLVINKIPFSNNHVLLVQTEDNSYPEIKLN